MQANDEIRQLIPKNNIERWRIAEELELTESDLLRLLADELLPIGKAVIMAALKKIAARRCLKGVQNVKSFNA